MNPNLPDRSLSRRDFLIESVTASVVISSQYIQAASELRATPASPVIDCHAHFHHRSRPTWESDDRKLIDAADRAEMKRNYYASNILFVDEVKLALSRATLVKTLQAEGVKVSAHQYPLQHKMAL
jgi:hypothetical protein